MIRGELMGKEKVNHKDNTSKTKKNIYLYTKKNIEKHMDKIDKMIRSQEKSTLKNVFKYLWSLIVLGVNWMVYQKVFVVLLTVIVLVGALVWSPILGVMLCLLTPVFLELYGRYFYININNKYESIEKSEKQRLLIPSSLLIIWILLIFLIILLII